MEFSGMLLVCIQLFLIVISFTTADAADTVGCGGFVTSTVPIDFDKVVVKLFAGDASSATLKYESRCAPHNGYYTVPVYAHGQYTLKLEAPLGWSFSPEHVTVTIDGATDACSLQKDINFNFVGFGLRGNVLHYNGDTGPSGLTVKLFADEKSDAAAAIASTTTDDLGRYLFNSVTPGAYFVEPVHLVWSFKLAGSSSRPRRRFAVQLDTPGDSAPDVVVVGYDVIGRSTVSKTKSLKNLQVAACPANDKLLAPSNVNCRKPSAEDVTTFKLPKPLPAWLCVSSSNMQRDYQFVDLPPGSYVLRPAFKATNQASFDDVVIEPKMIEVDVGQASGVVKQAFDVTAFTIQGRVLSAVDTPLPNAQVLIRWHNPEGSKTLKTDADGRYRLTNVAPGELSISVFSEQFIFDGNENRVASVDVERTTIPDIVASKVLVCGSVQLKDNRSPADVVSVAVHDDSRENGLVTNVKPDETGNYCVHLPNGKYTLKGIILGNAANANNNNRAGDIVLSPTEHIVEVKSKPIVTGLRFSQYTSDVTIRLLCSPGETCSDGDRYPKVVLSSNRAAGASHRDTCQMTVVQPDNAAKNDKASAVRMECHFKSIAPGSYSAEISHPFLCFGESKKSIDVDIRPDNAPPIAVDFKQSGFSYRLSTSHAVRLVLTRNGGKDAAPLTTDVPGAGVDHVVCLERRGDYAVHVEGPRCVEFDPPLPATVRVPTLDSPQGHHSAVAGRVDVDITAATKTALELIRKRVEIVADEVVNEEDKQNARQLDEISLSPMENVKRDVEFGYSFMVHFTKVFRLQLRDPENLVIFKGSDGRRDIAASMPTEMEALVDMKCPVLHLEVQAITGHFVSGRVDPPVENVLVSLRITGCRKGQAGENANDECNEKVLTAVTDTRGRYRFGPFEREDLQTSVSFEKIGYVFEAMRDEPMSAEAVRLSAIDVRVTERDATSGEAVPLEGVLLSISGDNQYRNNTILDATGRFALHGLAPAKYFVRPMMKEYSFEPESTMITLTQGLVREVDVKATRVLYSAHGSVTTLNGRPFSSVTVVASPTGCAAGETLNNISEEGVTGSDGKFRIRGLKPKCKYDLVVANERGKATVVDGYPTTLPASVPIEMTAADFNDVKFVSTPKWTSTEVYGMIAMPEELKTRRAKSSESNGDTAMRLKTAGVQLRLSLYRMSNPSFAAHTTMLQQGEAVFSFPALPRDGEQYIVRLEPVYSDQSRRQAAVNLGNLVDLVSDDVVITANDSIKGVYMQLRFASPTERSSKSSVGKMDWGGSMGKFETTRKAFFLLPLAVTVGVILVNWKLALDAIISLPDTLLRAQAWLDAWRERLSGTPGGGPQHQVATGPQSQFNPPTFLTIKEKPPPTGRPEIGSSSSGGSSESPAMSRKKVKKT